MALDEVGVKAVVEGLQPYLAAIASMEKSVSKLAESHVRVAKASEQQAGALNRLTNYLQDSAKAAVKFFAAFAVIGLIEGTIFALVNAIFTFNAALEQAQISFSTLLGNRAEADQFIEQLQRFAAISTFTFEQAITKAQQLLAFGLDRNQIIPLLRDIGSFVASVGGSAAQIDRVSLALGQIVSKGKVAGEELRQLAEVGINGARILADTLGKSTEEILKLVEARQISAEVFIAAFRGQAGLKFGDLVEQQAKTAKIGFETVKDSAVLLVGTGFEPLFKVVRDLIVTLAQFGQNQNTINFMKQFAAVLQVVLQTLPIVVASIGAFFAAMAIARAVSFVQILAEAVHILLLFNARVILTTAAMEALNVVLSSTAGRLALIIIPITLLDLALRKFTGSGIIDHLTGQAAAADQAARALQSYGKQVVPIADLVKAGFGQEEAQKQFFDNQISGIKRVSDAIQSAQSVVERSQTTLKIPGIPQFASNIINPFGQKGRQQALDDLRTYGDALEVNKKELDEWVKGFLEAGPNVEQLGAAIEASGGKIPVLTEALERQKTALDLLAQARQKFLGTKEDVSFDDFLAGSSDLAARLKNVASQLQQGVDVPNNVIKKLRKDLKEAGAGLSDDFQALGSDLLENAKQAGKDVIKALDALFPDPDEVFRNWLKRLQIQTENLKAFTQNLFYILNQAQKAGITDLRQLGEVFLAAGPDRTAQFAQFLSIDPTAALAVIKPFVEATVGATGRATLDAYLTIQPQIKKSVTDTFTDATTQGILASQDIVLRTVRDFAAVIRSEYERSLILKPTASLSLGDQLTQEAQANTAANVAASNTAELTRRIDELNTKLQDGTISAAEYETAIAAVKRELSSSGIGFSASELNPAAPSRQAPSADTRFGVLGMTPQQIEDAAAKDADKAEKEFLKELERRLRAAGGGAIRQAFSDFWDRATTGFADRAAIEFAKIPDLLKPIAQDLVNLSLQAQQAKEQLLTVGQAPRGTDFSTLVRATFGDTEELSKQMNPFRQMIESGDLQDWANRVSSYLFLGLDKLEGQVGKDAQQIIDAFNDVIESRQITAKERIQQNFQDYFNLRFFNLGGGNLTGAEQFLGRIPEKIREGADAISQYGAKIRQLGNDFDNLASIDLNRIFDVEFLGSKNPLADALEAAEKAAQMAQDLGGWRRLGLAAITAWAAGLQDGTGLAGKTAQQVYETVKNFISAAIEQFDQLGSAVETALQNRNRKQEQTLVSGLQNQITRRQEYSSLEEEVLNKNLNTFIGLEEKQRDAINTNFGYQIESINTISRRDKEAVDEREKNIRRTLSLQTQALEDASSAELEGMRTAIDASKEVADAKSKDIKRINEERDRAFQHQIDLLNAEKDSIDEQLNARLQARKDLDRNERLAEIAAQLQTVTAPSKRKALLDEQTQLQRDIADDQARAAADAAKKNIDIQIDSTKTQQELLKETSEKQLEIDQQNIDSAEKVLKARETSISKQIEAQRRANDDYLYNLGIQTEAEKKAIQARADNDIAIVQNAIYTNTAYYNGRIETEKRVTADRLTELQNQTKDFIEQKNQQIATVQAYYAELNKPENIRLEALQIFKDPIKVEDILKNWNPQFQVLGQSIGQQIALGYNPTPIHAVISDSFAVLRAAQRFILETKGVGEDAIKNFINGGSQAAPTGFIAYNQMLQGQFQETANQVGPTADQSGRDITGRFMDGAIRNLGDKNSQLQMAVRAVFDDMFAQANALNLGVGGARSAGYFYQNPNRNIPQYATGAIVTRPHIAQVGEVPEIIAPLSELPKVLGQLAAGGGNVSVYVTVQGSVTTERDLTQSITNNIIKNQRRNVTSGIS